MRKIVICAALGLAACSAVPSQEEQARFYAEARQLSVTTAREDCQAYGYTPGSEDFTGCVERRAGDYFRVRVHAYEGRIRAIQADEDMRWAMAGAVLAGGGAAAAAAYSAPRYYTPAPVYPALRCRTVGNITSCN